MELCSTVVCIAYLYKYIYKGPTRNEVNIREEGNNDDVHAQEPLDEIKEHLRLRYVASTEAYWHVAGFKMYSMFPTVKPLGIHMPHENNVRINENTGEVTNEISKLQHYYARPRTEMFSNLTFSSFYENYYVSDKPVASSSDDTMKNSYGHSITPRKKGICHCRYFTLLPNAGELYYLQLLLKSKACYNTSELYTHNTRTFHTLREAALSRGLFSPISEYEDIFESAVETGSSEMLRDLIVTVTMEGAPGPLLVEKYFANLTDDFGSTDANEKKRRLYKDIQERLEDRGRQMEDFGFPSLPEINRTISLEDRLQHHENYIEIEKKLDDEKLDIIEYCVKKLRANKPKVLFIQAPAGHGKTLLARAMNNKFNAMGYDVVKSAPTGLAALLHENGSTAHSNYCLPVNDDEIIRSKISKNSARAHIYKNAIHMWDEAPNSHAKCIEAFEALLRDINDGNEPWGGIKLIIFFGKMFPLCHCDTIAFP